MNETDIWSKKTLRTRYRARRKALSQIEVFRRSYRIKTHFFEQDLTGVQHVHLFLPMSREREVNTYLIIMELWRRGIKTSVSKVVGDDLIHFPFQKKTELKRNRWRIVEPVNEIPLTDTELKTIDLVIIPLLVADQKGNRVGYGKGYYDRFLTHIPKALRVGVSLFPPIEVIADVDPWDAPLHALITPKLLYLID
ncbi:MAG: 5-formyltetrahydrofolate cyclo-ligase [Xanthomonadaceae bacterium]|nr:5-formyltetrahydrofolate cyclo-ligase [Xanthomonadaceae bacterium]